MFTRNVMLGSYHFGMNCPFNHLCCYKVLCCVVVIVVSNLRQYVLRVHSQRGCPVGELKSVKCERAKVRKCKNNTNVTLTLTRTLTLILY